MCLMLVAMESFLERTKGLFSAEQHLIDPESDNLDETSATAICSDDNYRHHMQEVCSYQPTHRMGTLRKRASTLADDPRYKGKRVKRSLLEDDEAATSSPHGLEAQNFMNISYEDQMDDFCEDPEGLEMSGDEAANAVNAVGHRGDGNSFCNSETFHLNHSAHTSDITAVKDHTGEEISKGIALRHQLQVWDFLMELRIKLHQLTTQVFDVFPSDVQAFARSEDLLQSVSSLVNVFETLQKLLILSVLRADKTGDDVKTASVGSDDGAIKGPTKVDVTVNSAVNKRSQRSEFAKLRDDVIVEWCNRTEVGSTKQRDLALAGKTTLEQIQLTLADKARLIKKLHKLKPFSADTLTRQNTTTNEDLVYDPESFYDAEFYQQQLRELIERTASDHLVLTEQLESVRSQRKRLKGKVDTRASKGRKLRFEVHQNLVNFMAPRHRGSWTDDTCAQLFSSLFGQTPTAALAEKV